MSVEQGKQVTHRLMHDEVNATQTLYIPPVRTRPPQNEEMAELSVSEDHLDEITVGGATGEEQTSADDQPGEEGTAD